MVFEVYVSNKQYRWRLKAKNGKTIADSSEAYLRKSHCLKMIAKIQSDAPTASIKEAE